MRILVTGGAGFIGSHLAERLLDAGHGIRVLDSFATGRRENLPEPCSELEIVQGDVRDTGLVRQCSEGVDAIAHLAAVASVQASMDDPRGTHATNLGGTLNVLEAARAAGVKRIVFASSAAVYGDSARVPSHERMPLKPLSPYAIDKLASEHYLAFYTQAHPIRGLAFRFFNVYGPRQDPSSPYSGVISIFAERLQQRSGLTLYGDGEQTRDFVFVADVVDHLYRGLTSVQDIVGAFNLGTGISTSINTLASLLEQIAGATEIRRYEPARAGDILHSRADTSSLVEHFGGHGFADIREGLSEYWSTLVPHRGEADEPHPEQHPTSSIQ